MTYPLTQDLADTVRDLLAEIAADYGLPDGSRRPAILLEETLRRNVLRNDLFDQLDFVADEQGLKPLRSRERPTIDLTK